MAKVEIWPIYLLDQIVLISRSNFRLILDIVCLINIGYVLNPRLVIFRLILDIVWLTKTQNTLNLILGIIDWRILHRT